MYRFCVGEKVEQFHVEANGTYSEEFNLGQSLIAPKFDEVLKLDSEASLEAIDDDPIATQILFNDYDKYMIIDKKSPHIVRVYDKNMTTIPRHKHDMIAVTYTVDAKKSISERGVDIVVESGLKTETRVIIEVINEYTYVID